MFALITPSVKTETVALVIEVVSRVLDQQAMNVQAAKHPFT